MDSLALAKVAEVRTTKTQSEFAVLSLATAGEQMPGPRSRDQASPPPKTLREDDIELSQEGTLSAVRSVAENANKYSGMI